jgi:hypothetical protein
MMPTIEELSNALTRTINTLTLYTTILIVIYLMR